MTLLLISFASTMMGFFLISWVAADLGVDAIHGVAMCFAIILLFYGGVAGGVSRRLRIDEDNQDNPYASPQAQDGRS